MADNIYIFQKKIFIKIWVDCTQENYNKIHFFVKKEAKERKEKNRTVSDGRDYDRYKEYK